MSCSAIKLELAEKLVFDDARVFRRLRIYDPSMGRLVTECAEAMRANSIIQSSVKILQSIAKNAERRKVRHLEEEEKELPDGEPGIRTEEEEEMYKPLVCFIAQYCPHYG